MKHVTIMVLVLMCVAPSVIGAITPLTSLPSPGTVSRIECEYKKDAERPQWAWNAYQSEHPRFAKESIFHYDLYLPSGYDENPQRRYPCIFVSSPGGNAKLGNLSHWVTNNEWIAVMLVESQNGSPEWLSNFIAAHDDVVRRCRVMNDLKYATGFSGGARCAATQVGVRGGFAGVILQGAGFNYGESGAYITDAVRQNKRIAVCMIMGDKDGNNTEVSRVQHALSNQTPLKIISFPGDHTEAPAEKMEEALVWMKDQLPAARRKSFHPPRVYECRMWTSAGGSTIEAKFIEQRAGQVVLEMKGGKRLAISLSKLGKADQEYLSGEK